jgi:predicted Zn-dependent peptidase
MEHDCVTLPNGLRIVQVEMPQMQSATIVVCLGVGSRHESDSAAGVSHLIEHMLFKGTARRSRARDISEAIDSVGGILNASTDKELTAYWCKTAREHTSIAIDLLSDMLMHSRCRPADLAREKNIITEELSMLADDPQDWVQVLTDEVMWPRQPLGREIAGSKESLGTLRREDVLAHMDLYYGPNNAVVGVAGGIDNGVIRDEIGAAFGEWGPVPAPPPPAAVIPEAAPRSHIQRKSIEQVHVCLTFPGIARDNPDRWPLDLLCTILGGGTSSRLFLRLRERLGLVYDVSMYSSHFSDTGSVTVYCAVDPKNTDRALEYVLAEIERIQRRGVPGLELRRAKQFYRGRLSLGLEDTHAVAVWFAVQEVLRHHMITPEEAGAAVDCIEGRDVMRVARELLRPERARLVSVGPVAILGTEARLAGA